MAKCKSCGSPLCSGCSAAKMKNESPLDFFGGNIAASALGASNAASQAMKARQAQASNTGAESAVQPMTNVTPAGSSLVNPFNPQAQAIASGVFGDQQMKQNAVGAPAMYKDGSPLEGNAFIGAKMAAEKAGKDTFEVGGKTFPVK
ncbi:MAG: hypothetical protein ACR2M9_01110 [Cyanophyceae cyanobacterium]